MRRRPWWILAGAMALLTQAAIAQDNGATDWFGRGIVRVRDNGTAVHLDLRVAAQGLLLRVVEHEPPRLLQAGAFPAGPSVVRIPPRPAEQASGTSNLGSGPVDPAAAERQALRERSNCIARRTGTDTDPLTAGTIRAECSSINRVPVEQPPSATTVRRAPPREYLLLVLTDQPLDTADLQARLSALAEVEPGKAAHDVAEFLVGRRSPMWAGYLARR